MSIVAIVFSFVAPTLIVFADTEDARRKFDQEVNEHLKDAESATDIIEILSRDAKDHPKPNKNTIAHVMKRLFNPGEYINDVEYGVLSNKLDVEKSDILVGDRYACNPNAPNNLINHNCNIPNFTTGLIQALAHPAHEPFAGAEKTSAYAPFGLGVPNDIPGGKVPVVPGNRAHTYTALEIFGYNLKLTSYNGEWDKIDVSTEARMLSNFGIIDRITLTGTSLWNATRSGMSALIENFSFNPTRWLGGAARVVESTLTGGLNTVIDTSDLNIVASNGWKRDSFSRTLYNVYVMTDVEVLNETYRKYFQIYIDKVIGKSEENEEMQKVLRLASPPDFTFIEDWETEESKQARQAAQSQNAQAEEGDNLVEVPAPVYYTESEQLVFWAEDNAGVIAEAAEEGLISSDVSEYASYSELVETWNRNYEAYFSRVFDAQGEVVMEMLEDSDIEIFKDYPHLDPKQPISQYACANEDGTMMRASDGSPEYLYLKNNKGTEEFLNPKCAKARPPIGGGFLGSGWHLEREPDTRHIHQLQDDDFTGMFKIFTTAVGSGLRNFNSFIAKVTNVFLGLAFSPILADLGIDEIVKELIAGFRDTIFFPMASLVIVIGTMVLLYRVLRNGSLMQFFISTAITALIFIIGSIVLIRPEVTVKMIDEVPASIDNFVANAVLSDGDGSDYCSTGTDKDGIRTAQCNVWGALVFNPWVHLQFGTGYDNLYANGHAPANLQSFQNTNGDLVGDASVYLGNGVTVNNWAIYQLDKTKAGTINNWQSNRADGIGTVDRDLYRLVDLQAGPNNGAGTDSRYFEVWRGDSPNGLLVILTTIQAILTLMVVVSLSYLKIEASLLFSLYMIFLPFVLLFALTPQGKPKLRSYLANLLTLLIRRVVIVVMIGILLKSMSAIYANAGGIAEGALISIALCFAMMIYRKEILDLITKTEGGMFNGAGELGQNLLQKAPRSARQAVYIKKRQIQGSVAGTIGGTLGFRASQFRAKSEYKQLLQAYEDLEKKSKQSGHTEEDKKELTQIEAQLEDLRMKIDGEDPNFTAQNARTQGKHRGRDMIGNRAKNKMRREGFGLAKITKKAKEEVLVHGAQEIAKNKDALSSETYREVLSRRKGNDTRETSYKFSEAESRLLKDPKVQKEIRKLAKKRLKENSEVINDKHYTALVKDEREIQKLADKLDKKKNKQYNKGKIFDRKTNKRIDSQEKFNEENRELSSSLDKVLQQLEEEDRREKEERKRREEENK